MVIGDLSGELRKLVEELTKGYGESHDYKHAAKVAENAALIYSATKEDISALHQKGCAIFFLEHPFINLSPMTCVILNRTFKRHIALILIPLFLLVIASSCDFFDEDKKGWLRMESGVVNHTFTIDLLSGLPIYQVL